MSFGDKQLRTNAVAFRADWWGNNTLLLNFFDNNDNMTGDLRKLTASGYINPTSFFPQQVPMRFTQPEQGQLINAALTLNITAPSNGGIGVRICGGKFLADGVTVDTSYYTGVQIAADWKKISGQAASVSVAANGNLFIDGLNLSAIIPRRGDANFNGDGFIICVVFDSAPAVDGNAPLGYKLKKFNIACSAQLAVL